MIWKILIGLAVFIVLVVGAGVFLYYKIQPSIREAEARIEAKQKMLQPRLVKGEGDFKRRAFYAGEGLGNISEIRVGWPADREGASIAVVGSQGADFLESTGQVKKQVRFSIAQRCPVAVARLGPSGAYGYLTRDESWAVPTTLFDKDGHVSWRSEENLPGVDDSVPADLYGDGKLSVVIGFNGNGGLALFDEQGKRLWKKEEHNVWHVETLDIDGDGREEILHSNAKGELLVRNGSGDRIAQYLPGTYVSQFAITRWGEESRPSHILVPISESGDGCCKPALLVLESHGKEVAHLQSPLGNLFTQTSATPIRFAKSAQYFAVLKNDFVSERSMLLLYAEDTQIVFQEILVETCLGMAALPKNDGERLLVGCASKIWEYSPVRLARDASKENNPSGQ
jgi:hypothetical protein